MFVIRPAVAGELPSLSDLCRESKAYWGYDDAFLCACREELTLTVEELATTSIAVIEEEGRPVGVVQIAVDGSVAEILKLFVQPSWIGRGHGARLFRWAVAEAKRLGATRVRAEADPGAVPFYRRMGARVIGTAPSGSIPGRSLPVLELSLD